MELTKEEFEQKCIEVLEEIILTSKTMTREQAIDLAKQMLAHAQSDKKYEGEVVNIYQRVVNELVDATNDDFNQLKKHLFK